MARQISRKRRERERGFTMPEIIVAGLISISLSAAVLGVISASMKLTADSQSNIATEANTQEVLDAFARDLRDATNVISPVAAVSMTFDVQRYSNCERHGYTFGADVDDATRRQLTHTVRTVSLATGQTCSDVIDPLADTSARTSRVELSNLGTNSEFRYFDQAGTPRLAADFTTAVNPDCPTATTRYTDLGSAKMIINSVTTGTGQNVNSINEIQAAPRALAMGVSC